MALTLMLQKLRAAMTTATHVHKLLTRVKNPKET